MRKRIGILFLLLVTALLTGLLAVAPVISAAPACRQPDSFDGAKGILCPKPTPKPSSTFTPTPSPTFTPTPSPTSTPTSLPTATPTFTPLPTSTPTAVPTITPSATPAPTETAVPSPTSTATPTTPPPSATPSPIPERHTRQDSISACARFNLDMGRNGRTGATIPGRYEMIEVGTGRSLAQWEAQANWTCSPWLDNIRLSFKGGQLGGSFLLS